MSVSRTLKDSLIALPDIIIKEGMPYPLKQVAKKIGLSVEQTEQLAHMYSYHVITGNNGELYILNPSFETSIYKEI